VQGTTTTIDAAGAIEGMAAGPFKNNFSIDRLLPVIAEKPPF